MSFLRARILSFVIVVQSFLLLLIDVVVIIIVPLNVVSSRTHPVVRHRCSVERESVTLTKAFVTLESIIDCPSCNSWFPPSCGRTSTFLQKPSTNNNTNTHHHHYLHRHSNSQSRQVRSVPQQGHECQSWSQSIPFRVCGVRFVVWFTKRRLADKKPSDVFQPLKASLNPTISKSVSSSPVLSRLCVSSQDETSL